MNLCSQCGRQNPPEEWVCECGFPLGSPAAQSSAATPAPSAPAPSVSTPAAIAPAAAAPSGFVHNASPSTSNVKVLCLFGFVGFFVVCWWSYNLGDLLILPQAVYDYLQAHGSLDQYLGWTALGVFQLLYMSLFTATFLSTRRSNMAVLGASMALLVVLGIIGFRCVLLGVKPV